MNENAVGLDFGTFCRGTKHSVEPNTLQSSHSSAAVYCGFDVLTACCLCTLDVSVALFAKCIDEPHCRAGMMSCDRHG